MSRLLAKKKVTKKDIKRVKKGIKDVTRVSFALSLFSSK